MCIILPNQITNTHKFKEVKTWVSVWIGRKGIERAERTKQQEKISTEVES